MKCPKCNREIEREGAKFCPHCGTELVDTYAADEAVDNNYNNYNSYNNYNNYTAAKNQSEANKKSNIAIAIAAAAAVVIFGFIIGNYIINQNSYNSKTEDAYVDSDENYIHNQADNKVIITEPATEATTKEPAYAVYFEDISWYEAENKCFDMGGHLVTFDTQEEFNKVINIISEYDLKSVYYIGGFRDQNSNDYYWIDSDGFGYGEPINNLTSWLPGEPSFYDKDTGLTEDCVNLFYSSSVGRWVINDIPNDYLSVASYKAGRVGYICEID